MPVSYYYNVMHEAVIYAENQKKCCKFIWSDPEFMVREKVRCNDKINDQGKQPISPALEIGL